VYSVITQTCLILFTIAVSNNPQLNDRETVLIYTYDDEYGGVELIDAWGDDKRAVHAARISFAKEGTGSDLTERDVRLLRFMIKEGHTSPFEHSGLTFKIVCPLFVRSQIMRHRTFSFNEVSRRYTSDDLRIYVPKALRQQADKNLQCSIADSHVDREDMLVGHVGHITDQAESVYNYLIAHGVSREQARGVLPQNTYTSFWMTGNLHNWFKFLKLRLHEHVQPETRVIAEEILNCIEDKFPVTTMLMSEVSGVLPLSSKDSASETNQ